MNPDSHMDPDNFQQAWQAQSSRTRVTIDADLLRKEVQHSQRSFRAMIFWRDCREVGIALLMLPVWFYLGSTRSLPWTWYLTMPALVWVAGFILVDRIRSKRKPSEPGEPLRASVRESLAQVEHQIWLLRNIFWWYLMPFAISILAFIVHVAWLRSGGSWKTLGLLLFIAALYGVIYFLNQFAVRLQLEPRRRELLALLTSLGDEAASGEAAAMANAEGPKKPGNPWRTLFIVSLCGVALTSIALVGGLLDSSSSYEGAAKSDGPASASLAGLVADLRKQKKLVGLAAMVTVDGKVMASAADGERKIGSGVPIELGDCWHLGGISKAITATMIARLVEAGRMQWTDTVGECFPEAAIHEDWKPVTLKQLLTDTAGAPANFPFQVMLQRPALGPECTRERRETVLDVMAEKPVYPPGKKFAYSNVGYTIAGAMAEKATGTAWEDLVKREVFEPLKLSSAGFGPPKSSDESLEEPRGHRLSLSWKVPANDYEDNTPIIGPAATVHMTLSDLCTFAREHMRGQLGEGQLLSAETYKLLHTPELEYYAYGWIRTPAGRRTPYTAFWHNGANTMWYALVAFIPEKNMVVAVAANDGDFKQAEAAAWEIVTTSARPLGAEADPPGLEPAEGTGYPKKSPFAAVRWQQAQPEVKVGQEWFKLVSLDDLPATEIVAFSQRTFDNRWRKRFEEDLVELLTRMGHEPKETVRLEVSPLESSATQTLEAVPMTEANRRAIYDAARNREQGE
jgi:CubicO group peptidase (beta-lactamase class C family)